MSAADFFSVEPCFDETVGANDYSLMERIGLPETWIARLKALEAWGTIWIGVREYYWTPDDWFRVVHFEPTNKKWLADIRQKTGGCFYYLTLADQSRVLSLTLLCSDVSREKISNKEVWRLDEQVFHRVEDVALALLRRDGWQGLADEGGIAHATVSLIRRAVERNTGVNITALLSSALAAGDAKANWQAIHEYVETDLDDNWIYRALHEDSDWAVHTLCKEGTIESMKTAWTGLGATFFARLVVHSLKHTRGVLSGWPDLTLWKDTAVRFVEVKQKDKLHRNQAYWIRNIARPLGLDVSVLRVRAV